MRTENIKEELSRYVVVLRSQSAAIFESGFPVLIRNYPTPFGRVDITFYTKYENRGLSVEVPRHLLIEVLGEAPSLDAAIHSFKAAASDLVPSVSFSVNAYIEMPGVWLAFDASDGVEERDFFQVQYFDSYGQLESARVANSDVIAQFHSCLFKAHDTERLGRAVGQYHMALNNWEYGKEIISIEHLFIAAEVITPIIRNRLCEQNGTDSDGLSEIFNIEKKKLDAEIRRKF
ncbi:MAG: hypothetical protein OEY38_13740, partial [Gammaproteobacteria bacterium]|nr:hypothetical protein [Gammaproteobacteria bacterium]